MSSLRRFLTRDFLLVFLGTGLRLAGRLAAFLLVSHWLGKERFGLFGAAIDTAEIAESFSDLGTDTTSVTFASRKLREGDESGVTRVFHTALWIKIVVSTGVMLAGWAVSSPLAAALGYPALAPALRLAFLLVPAKQFYRLGNNVFQARQQFGRLSIYILLPPLLIVAGALAFRAAGAFTLNAAVMLYAVTPGLAFFAGVVWVPRAIFSRKLPARNETREMIRFGRWVYLSTLLGTLRFRANTYLLLAFSTPAALGDYQYAVRLAGMLNLITESATLTLLPKMTARVGAEEVAGYTRRTLRRLAVILLPLAALGILIPPALRFVQPEFASAAPAAVTLYLSVLASIAAIPLTTALYALRRPHVETVLETANLVVLLALGALFIRLFADAAFGAALALLIQRVADFGAMAVLVRRAIKQEEGTLRGEKEEGGQ